MNKIDIDTVKIFVDGVVYCSASDCSIDCEGYAFIEKDWFYKNYLNISGFSNEEEFFSNYLYPDAEKILKAAIEDDKLIDLSIPLNCCEFKFNKKFKRITIKQ